MSSSIRGATTEHPRLGVPTAGLVGRWPASVALITLTSPAPATKAAPWDMVTQSASAKSLLVTTLPIVP